MNKIQIDDKLSISDQITIDDVKELADEGVKILMCNRPDGEEPNQLTCAQVKAAADENGMQFVHIPVSGRDIPYEVLEKFTTTLDSCSEKIHAYCRTGTRSSFFWGLHMANKNSTNEILAKAESLGFSLAPIADKIEEICKQK